MLGLGFEEEGFLRIPPEEGGPDFVDLDLDPPLLGFFVGAIVGWLGVYIWYTSVGCAVAIGLETTFCVCKGYDGIAVAVSGWLMSWRSVDERA